MTSLLASHSSTSAECVASGANDKPYLHNQIAPIRADGDMADIWTSREACGVYANGEMVDLFINLARADSHCCDIGLSIAFERAFAAVTNLQVHSGYLIDEQIPRIEPERPDS